MKEKWASSIPHALSLLGNATINGWMNAGYALNTQPYLKKSITMYSQTIFR